MSSRASSDPRDLRWLNKFNTSPLPQFQLFGRWERKELNEFNALSRPIRDLLEQNFDPKFWGEMRLSPQDNTHVVACFTHDDKGQAIGNALISYEENNVNFLAHLTNKKRGKAGFSLRLYPSETNSIVLISSGETELDDVFAHPPKNGRLGVALRHSPASIRGLSISTEIVQNLSKSQTEAYVIGRYAGFTLGADMVIPTAFGSNLSGNRRLRVNKPSKCDLVFSLSGRSKREQIRQKSDAVSKLIASSEWRKPEYYNLTLRVSDMGKKLQASYYHQMHFPRLLSINRSHNVVLGGEFTHETGSGSSSEGDNSLTVGGAWQLHERFLVKARANTRGDVNVTVGTSLGKFPVLTLAATAAGNVHTQQTKFGLSLVVEDTA